VKTYEVVATRSGNWWALEVTGLKMGYSQARTRADIEPMARELIALLTKTAEDSFGITVRVEGDGPLG
jgi:predicted RNase H-like HicB family nuclease